MENFRIAEYLDEIADYLEATKNNFRARAYRKGANVISNLKVPLTTLIDKNFDIKELPYIGKGIELAINKILQKNFVPIDFILNSRTFVKKIQTPPFRLHHAKRLEQLIIYILKKISGILTIHSTGELRRNIELINDLKFIIITNDDFTWDSLKKSQFINDVIEIAGNEVNVTILNYLKINLIRTKKENFGTTQLIHTGSTSHVNHLKKMSKMKKFNFPNHSEKEIYSSLKMSYVEPEMREDNGEIQNALRGVLPKLVSLKDIKGDLHCHTNETDGVLDLDKMINCAIEQGYEYLSITDHSQSLKITNGLNKKRLFKQIKLIDEINNKLKNFTVLKSTECDILEDGSLDFPNEVLKELDFVVCSVHSKFRLTKDQQTTRILRAIENPYCTILGHPTGRLINSRLPYEIDLDKILIQAKECGCILELNAQPYRLDLKAEYCKLAKNMGIKISISSDAHSMRGLKFMSLGVMQARRAGLEAQDIINTFSLVDLKKIIRKQKHLL